MGTKSIPHDKINLRLILVNGKSKDFQFSLNDSASFVAEHVYENWEEARKYEGVTGPQVLKLIYQGRFLHGNVILGALLLPLGKTSVMHLVARENLPEPNSQEEKKQQKRYGVSPCNAYDMCCRCCCRIS